MERVAAARKTLEQTTERKTRAAQLRLRGKSLALAGQWSEATVDFSELVKLDPNDHQGWYLLAPLLLNNRNLEGYRKHCQTMLAKFSAANDPQIAERTVKVCLLLPMAGADLAAASKLADTAVTVGKDDRWVGDLAYFQFAKGLAEYREGRFAAAAEWANKALHKPGEDFQRDVQAYAVLAMARYQLGQTNEARAVLSNAEEVTETKLQKLDSGSLGESWHNVLIAHILLREAKTVVGSDGSAGGKP